MKYFKRGEKATLAREAGIKFSNLSGILSRKRKVSKEMAIHLAMISERVLEEQIPWDDWLFNQTSSHPAFTGPIVKGAPMKPRS